MDGRGWLRWAARLVQPSFHERLGSGIGFVALRSICRPFYIVCSSSSSSCVCVCAVAFLDFASSRLLTLHLITPCMLYILTAAHRVASASIYSWFSVYLSIHFRVHCIHKKEAKILYAFYAMLRTMKDNYENIVQRFHVFGGVGGFFSGISYHTRHKIHWEKCALARQRLRPRREQPPPTTVENALSGQVDPRSVTAPTSPSAFVLVLILILIRPLSHCVARVLSQLLSLRTERGLFERPLPQPTHNALVVVVVVPASTVGSLSLSLSFSGCLCRGNFAPTRISNCALFMFLMDVSLILVALSEAMIHMYKQLHTQWNMCVCVRGRKWRVKFE